MPESWKNGVSTGEGGYASYGGPKLPDDWEIVADIDVDDEPYEFSLINVWRAPDGSLWGAADWGYSCPEPFTDLTPEGCKRILSTHDLTPLLVDLGYTTAVGAVHSNERVADLIATVARALPRPHYQ